MYRTFIFLLSFLIAISGTAGALAKSANSLAVTNSLEAESGYRIVLTKTNVIRAAVDARHSLGPNRVSAHVTEVQLQRLQRLGIPYEVVPIRWVEAAGGAGKGKPDGGSLARVLPTTQVPYGIKMIYGDPNLQPVGISGGAGITVAILDTGSVAHPDFTRPDGSQVITGCVDFSQKRRDLVEGSCEDGHGHGTHVTGTAAAAGGIDGKGIFGVAPSVNVYSYKVLNDRGMGYADDIARGIWEAADRGAHIITLSLGMSTPSIDELAAIRYAVSKGVLVVAAAGNSGPGPDSIAYPAGFAEAMAVAALNPDEAVAYFSSRGLTDGNDEMVGEREVEVAAPGRQILSTAKDGGYEVKSGTSMAAPHVAGLAAKVWQGSASQTRTWLQRSAQGHDIVVAEQVNNAGSGYDIASGFGLPQVSPFNQSQWLN